jgi:DMSO/TMAO reductase YedYZ heme-binding membrane subunit
VRELAAARGSGLVAGAALIVALAVTPLATFARAGSVGHGRAALVRRALGMAAGWLALAHATIAFVGPLHADPGALTQTAHLGAGLAALCVLTLLLATSFAAVVRHARLRFWKELHRLSYVAALLVLQHLALSPGASRALVLGLCAALAVVFVARIVAALAARWRS